MKRKYLMLVASVLLVCTGAVNAQELTFDGLEKVNKGVFKDSWVDPDVDFTQYTKIAVVPAQFEFRAVKKTSSLVARRSNAQEFYISDRDKQRLIDTVTEIFDEELQKSEHYSYVTEPGPDVMILRGGIFDIVSRVPPELAGQNEIYLSSVGEGALVLELLDSLSGETIYRAVERRAAQPPGRQMRESNVVTNWADVRRWASRWAVRLREGLDSIHEE